MIIKTCHQKIQTVKHLATPSSNLGHLSSPFHVSVAPNPFSSHTLYLSVFSCATKLHKSTETTTLAYSTNKWLQPMKPRRGLSGGAGEQIPPGKPMSMEQHMLDKGAQMLQSLKPIKQMKQHVCTFAMYSHDMARQIETHHYVTRLNQDFLQCAVYDSDDSTGRLIGVEYIISDRLFEGLPPDEQKLWHSHAYEIKSGLWVTPRVPVETVVKPELDNLAKTYGKFWCTWQTDRGDELPMGPPALMMSPQAVDLGMVKPNLVLKRDDKYNISSDALKTTRAEIAEPEWINPQADYWKQHGKGFAVDLESTEMKKMVPFP